MLKKIFWSLFLLILTFTFISSASKAFAFNLNANLVEGQKDFIHSNTNGAYPGASSMYLPGGVATDGTHFFVTDTGNNRVLIYNSIPTSTNAPADVIVGQTSFAQILMNQGQSNPGANTLRQPEAVATDGTHLFIMDSGNNRVLIYNHIPTSNNASADIEIGQPDMNTRGLQPLGANSIDNAQSVSYDSNSGKLVITDTWNNRVLIFNAIPTSNNASADVVVGQSDMTSNLGNQGGSTNANTLQTPFAARIIQGKLMVVDGSNARVLIFNSVPASNNASADVVIGQSNMTSAGEVGIGANTMLTPFDVSWDGSHLLVEDGNNHRVLIYNSIPTSNNAYADVVVGQPDFTSDSSGLSDSSLYIYNPGGIVVAGGTLFVSDIFNNRVVGFGNYLTSTVATIVLGQADFNSKYINGFTSSTTSSLGYNYPWGVASDGTRLFVSDCNNNRVLIYNHFPSTANVSADVVIGQPDMTSNLGNQGGSATANTLDCPAFLAVDGSKLIVTDSNNNRVLIYNSIPTSNNASADVVVGQNLMSDSSSNQDGSAGANTLSYPTGVDYDNVSGKLVITDANNNRVLIYNSIPTSNNASADVVVGQNLMSDSSSNQDGSAGANTLDYPSNARILNNKLLVADANNNRVLIYNSIPTSNNASADVVVGQNLMSDNSSNQGGSVTGNTLKYPTDVYLYDNKLLVQDDGNNRVLLFNGIPTTNNTSATDAVGQADLTSGGAGTTQNTFNDPEGQLAMVGTNLIVGDSKNNRVLLFQDFLGTNSSSSNSSSSNSSSSNSSSTAPGCGNTRPGSVPDLFQANTTSNKVTLYFAPAAMPYSSYFVSYGLSSNAEGYGVEFNQSQTGGVIAYQVNQLSSNTYYYFKVRAGNGCATGEWSNILKVYTGGNIFYKYNNSLGSQNFLFDLNNSQTQSPIQQNIKLQQNNEQLNNKSNPTPLQSKHYSQPNQGQNIFSQVIHAILSVFHL